MGASVTTPDTIVAQEFFTFLAPSTPPSQQCQIKITRERHSAGYVEYSISFPGRSPPVLQSTAAPCSSTPPPAPAPEKASFPRWRARLFTALSLRFERG